MFNLLYSWKKLNKNLIINKLGDSGGTIITKTMYIIKQLIQDHLGMKIIIIIELK